MHRSGNVSWIIHLSFTQASYCLSKLHVWVGHRVPTHVTSSHAPPTEGYFFVWTSAARSNPPDHIGYGRKSCIEYAQAGSQQLWSDPKYRDHRPTRARARFDYLERVLLLRPGNNYGCRASQRIQVKAQSAGNGHCPFQGLQRRIGSSGTLPLGEPESGRPRCCASGQGRRPFPARRALRSTAFPLAASVVITWTEYYGPVELWGWSRLGRLESFLLKLGVGRKSEGEHASDHHEGHGPPQTTRQALILVDPTG